MLDVELLIVDDLKYLELIIQSIRECMKGTEDSRRRVEGMNRDVKDNLRNVDAKVKWKYLQDVSSGEGEAQI